MPRSGSRGVGAPWFLGGRVTGGTASKAERHAQFRLERGEYQHKQRMADHGPLKRFEWRVGGDAVVTGEVIDALGVCLQHEGRLISGQFSGFDRFPTMPKCDGSRTRCPQNAHSIHHAIGGAGVALAIPLNHRDRDRVRLSTFAPMHREQVHG